MCNCGKKAVQVSKNAVATAKVHNQPKAGNKPLSVFSGAPKIPQNNFKKGIFNTRMRAYYEKQGIH